MRRTLMIAMTLTALLAAPAMLPATADRAWNGTVCLIADEFGFDDPFAHPALSGAERAARMFQVGLLAEAPASYAELPGLIESLVAAGECDLIIGVGFRVGGEMVPFASAHPGQRFAVLDFFIPSPNVASVLFRIDQPSFLAGYLAASVSETGKVGVYGGGDIVPVTMFMDGYALGVDYYNQMTGSSVVVLGWDPDTRVGIFTFDFQNPAAGYAVTIDLFEEGADVVFAVAGGTGIGSLDAAADRKAAGQDVLVIEPDLDYSQAFGDPARILLTSVTKNLDVAAFHQIEALVDGTWIGGELWEDLASDGVGLAKFHKTNNQVSGTVRAELRRIAEGIVGGGIPTLP